MKPLVRAAKEFQIASCGLTSRRKDDCLIGEGRVRLNGDKVFEMGVQIDPRNDEVTVDGKAIRAVVERLFMKEAPIFKVQNKSQHKRPRVLSTKRRLASSADLA